MIRAQSIRLDETVLFACLYGNSAADKVQILMGRVVLKVGAMAAAPKLRLASAESARIDRPFRVKFKRKVRGASSKMFPTKESPILFRDKSFVLSFEPFIGFVSVSVARPNPKAKFPSLFRSSQNLTLSFQRRQDSIAMK